MYFTPIKPLTLALRGKYGLIQPYGSNAEAPEDQLFFLGGTSTVRGFEEDLLRFDADNKAVGGGIRYLTPIGPVSLLYGRNLGPKPGESNGSFHFSMGYTF